jgi:hypothetical protein
VKRESSWDLKTMYFCSSAGVSLGGLNDRKLEYNDKLAIVAVYIRPAHGNHFNNLYVLLFYV